MLRSTARVVFLIAPAGYGKTTTVNALRADYEYSATCDCLDTQNAQSFVRDVLVSLTNENPSQEPFFSDLKALLSSAESDAECATILDAAWSRTAPASLFIFENAEAIAANTPVAALITRLLNTAPAARRVIVCSRVPLPTRASRYLPPHLISTLTAADLALNETEAAMLLEQEGVDPAYWDRIVGVAQGWPVVLLLLARLSHEGLLEAALSDASNVAFEDFFIYFLNEVLAPMDAGVKKVLTLCAAVPALTLEEARACSGLSELQLESIVRKSALIRHEGQGYAIHPLVRDVLLQNEPGWRNLLLPVARLAEERAKVYRAVQLYRLAGDNDAAARSLAGLSMKDLQNQESRYELMQLPLEVFQSYPKLIAASTVHRSDVSPQAVSGMFDRLSEQDDPDVIAAIVTAYLFYTEIADSSRDRIMGIFQTPLIRHAVSESASARAQLAGVEQVLAVVLGSGVSATEGLTNAYDLSAAAMLPYNCQLVAEHLSSIKRFSGDREGGSHWTELALAHGRTCGPQVHAAKLLSAIFDAWFWGDDSAVDTYYEELIAAEAATHDAEYFRSLRALDPQTIDSALPVEPTLFGWRCLLLAASKVDGARRQRLLEGATKIASALARLLALTMITRAAGEPAARASICDEIAALVNPVEMPEFRAAILAYGKGQSSFLDSYAARFEPDQKRAKTTMASSSVYVQILRECLLIEGRVIRLTPREAAVLTLLSRNRSGAAREAIQDAIWPDLDELRARDSLYSLLHRLRKRLGGADIVDSIGNGYRLAGGVQVDVWDIEYLTQRVLRDPSIDAFGEVQRHYAMIQQRAYPHLKHFEWFSAIDFRVHEFGRILTRFLVDEAMKRRDHDAVTRYANELIQEDPCDGWAHEVAIRNFLESENLEEAARAYKKCCALLKSELGAKPSQALQELARSHQLLAG